VLDQVRPSNELPSLEELARLAAEAFPEARVGLVKPLLAKPYVLLSKGFFAAVLLRPEENHLTIREGLPNNGFAVALGGLALFFGVKERRMLHERVTLWAREQQGWELSIG
jgi:hypothetical protein